MPTACVLAVLVAALALAASAANTITFSGVVYDMNFDHPDVERSCCGCFGGIVMDQLGPDRKPVFRGGIEAPGNPLNWPPRGQFLKNQTLTADCRPSTDSPPGGIGNLWTTPLVTTQQYYDEWYRDSPGHNFRVPVKLVFNETSPGSGIYQFNRKSPLRFFPVDSGFGWGDDDDQPSLYSNFFFGIQIIANFIYQPGMVFSFSGDDDVWVFVNNKLIADLGGVHAAVGITVQLSDIAAQVGLVPGQRYPFALFQAERHTSESNSLITTSILPTNQPPSNSDQRYEMAAGVNLTAPVPAFDPDTTVLSFAIVTQAGNPATDYLTFDSAAKTFTFRAPATQNQTTVVYSVLYTVSDGEFTSCTATLSFAVTAVVVPQRNKSKPLLDKTTTIALAVVGSVLVILAVVGIIGIALYSRTKWSSWEAEVAESLHKAGLLQNPLYADKHQGYENPMYQQ